MKEKLEKIFEKLIKYLAVLTMMISCFLTTSETIGLIFNAILQNW